MPRTCDIFCKVIDNYGDIGVCWRLAKQLQTEHHWKIRLWVDDLPTAKQLIPSLEISQLHQQIASIEICLWQDPITFNQPADIVIEAFACELPSTYLAAMKKHPPIWINLEYLSAEAWVDDFHAKNSPHPQTGLAKNFFFPGFTPNTGGLLREQMLDLELTHFHQSAEVRTAFLSSISNAQLSENTLNVSMFCYPDSQLINLLDSLSNYSRPINLFIPHTLLKRFAKYANNEAQLAIQYGNLTIHPFEFLSQNDYDHLLWSCDLNFVRGEDSWIRAIWAKKPFVWQPYRQQEDVHMHKLDAFVDIYTPNMPNDVQAYIRNAHHAWSNTDAPPQTSLSVFIDHLDDIAPHYQKASHRLMEYPDLASNLVIFCEKILNKSSII